MTLIATVSRIYECSDDVLRKKPIRKPGEDLQSLPTYTIPEAAEALAIDAWTLLGWYSKRDPMLKPSGWYGESEAFALLSFRDIEEAYKLHLLRTKFGYSLQYLRKALIDARQESKSDHPLIDNKMIAFDHLAMYRSGRGRRHKQVIALGSRQQPLYIPEVIETWGKRIVADSKGRTRRMFPWRFAKSDDVSRPVTIDPEVMSGRLVVTGTRIPVAILWRRKQDGETAAAIAKDYGIDVDLVQNALKHIGKHSETA